MEPKVSGLVQSITYQCSEYDDQSDQSSKNPEPAFHPPLQGGVMQHQRLIDRGGGGVGSCTLPSANDLLNTS